MPKNVEATNEYDGYSLFNDIEDATLRGRNRGVVMANMMETHMKSGKVTPKGMLSMLKYMSFVPLDERQVAMDNLKAQLKERHIEYG